MKPTKQNPIPFATIREAIRQRLEGLDFSLNLDENGNLNLEFGDDQFSVAIGWRVEVKHYEEKAVYHGPNACPDSEDTEVTAIHLDHVAVMRNNGEETAPISGSEIAELVSWLKKNYDD